MTMWAGTLERHVYIVSTTPGNLMLRLHMCIKDVLFFLFIKKWIGDNHGKDTQQ